MFVAADEISQLSVPSTMPAIMGSYPSGMVNLDKHFLPKLLLFMVFYDRIEN